MAGEAFHNLLEVIHKLIVQSTIYKYGNRNKYLLSQLIVCELILKPTFEQPLHICQTSNFFYQSSLGKSKTTSSVINWHCCWSDPWPR